MKDKDLIRIINKSKEGPTLKVGHNTIKYTWDEFNSMYDIVNLVYAKMKPEAKEKFDLINEKIDTLASLVIIGESPDPSNELAILARIGELAEEIQKDLNCNIVQLRELVSKRVIAFNKSMHSYKSHKPHKEDDSPEIVVFAEKKSTFADLPGMDKLKNKFNLK